MAKFRQIFLISFFIITLTDVRLTKGTTTTEEPDVATAPDDPGTQTDAVLKAAPSEAEVQTDAVLKAAPGEAEAQTDAVLKAAPGEAEAQTDAVLKAAPGEAEAQTDAVLKAAPGEAEAQTDAVLKAAPSEAEAQTDAILKAAPDEEEEQTSKKDEKNSKDKAKDKDSLFNAEGLQKRYEKIKNNKNSKGLKGKSGKVMQIVVEAIKDINPVRIMMDFDPDPLLKVNGVDVEKVQIPASYFSDHFFNRFGERTKWSKKELSKELNVDIEHKKPGTWFSLGTMLKAGKKKDLKLGDYLHFIGMEMKAYEEKYDNFLIDTVRVPVEFIDEILSEGFDKYMKMFKDYVSNNGGPMNAAFKAYGDYSGQDIVKQTQQAIKKMKTFNVTSQKELTTRQWMEYKNATIKNIKAHFNDWFGKGGRIFVYQERVTRTINDFFKFLGSLYTGERLAAFTTLVGNAIGPEGKAIVYIVYQPTTTMLNQIFGPLLLIPKLLAINEEFYDKILAMPPVIIQTSGGIWKPILMVAEPFVRLLRFIVTGHYYKSLSAGLDIAATYGISIWGGAYKPKLLEHKSINETNNEESGPKKRPKRQAKTKNDAKNKKPELSPEEASRYTNQDKKLAEAYQGGPPLGGYKLGVKNDGTIDLDDEDMITRLLLSPDFLLKAGGPIFIPFVSVLAPCLRVVNTVLFGETEFNTRINEVPDIIRGVGFVGPLADVVQSLLPFIKTGYLIYTEKLTRSDLVVQGPSLVKQMANGVLYNVIKHPEKLWAAMSSFFPGYGGILSMLRLQATGNVPKFEPGASIDAREEIGPGSHFITKSLGEFFGGWALTYLEALAPIGSMWGSFFNGVLGNLLNPVRFLDTNVNLKSQPLKNLIECYDDLSRMLKSTARKDAFLTAVLGGQDPDLLKEIGIDAEKLAANGIDPAKLLAGGTKMLSEEAAKKLESGPTNFGINGELLSKVKIDEKKLLESGLLDANEAKLLETGIDLSSILNRMMRGSVEDDVRLMNAGINIKILLKAGVCPASFLAGGVRAIPPEKAKELGITNFNSLSDSDLKNLGLNPIRLHAKGINAKKLAADGIEEFAKFEGNLGISVKILMTSMLTGMEPKKLSKAGIDLKTILNNGIDTKTLLTGGLKKILKGDVSESSLAKIGINMKQVLSLGININILTDIGAGILNPMQLVKMGIEPMRVLIGTLSRHGLDTMTGGLDDATSLSFGFVNSILTIINNAVGLIPKIRELPGGKYVIGPDGRWIGIPGFFFYNIIGIDNHGGLFGLFEKINSGKFTTQEILQLLDPIRITNEIAHPFKKPSVPRRRKENRKAVDEYVMKSQNLRVGQSAEKQSKSSIFKSASD